MKAYAGIGSRQTPPDVLELMQNIAFHLGGLGWTLRSGCAPGADSAFERGARDAESNFGAKARGIVAPRPELYLPWPGFEGRQDVTLSEPDAAAFPVAKRFHPRWDSLKQGARKLHARNVHQIVGPDVTNPVPSRFVICWTPGGMGGGGTGQALRIASHYRVRVFDLAIPADRVRIETGMMCGA